MASEPPEPEGESDVFGLPTQIGDWEMIEESTANIVWRRDTGQMDDDPADGERKELYEWVIVKLIASGGAYVAEIRKGFLDTPMADRPQLMEIERGSNTDEGFEQAFTAAIEFMQQRGSSDEQPDEEETATVERVIDEEGVEQVGAWRWVQPSDALAVSGDRVLASWQDPDDRIVVFIEAKDGDDGPSYTARARKLDDDVSFANTSISTFSDSLESALEKTIKWMERRDPTVPLPTFSGRIEGGLFKPLMDLLRRLGSGKTLVTVSPSALAFESASGVSMVDFRIPASDFETFDVDEVGAFSVDTEHLWDSLKPVNYSDEVPVSIDGSEDNARFGIAGKGRIVRIAADYAQREPPALDAPDARFTIDGIEFRDKMRAIDIIEDDTAFFGRYEGIVFAIVEDAASGEEVTARIEETSGSGELVVVINPEFLQSVRKAMPRPSSTPITFTLQGELPILAEYTVGEADADVRIALKHGPVPLEIEVPPPEVTVPEGVETREEAPTEEEEEELEEFLEAAKAESETDLPTADEIQPRRGWELVRRTEQAEGVRFSWKHEAGGMLHISPRAEGDDYGVQFNTDRSNNLGQYPFEDALLVAEMAMDPLGFSGSVPDEGLKLYLERVIEVSSGGAEVLAERFKNFRAVREAGREAVGDLSGVGSTSVDRIFEFAPVGAEPAEVEAPPEEPQERFVVIAEAEEGVEYQVAGDPPEQVQINASEEAFAEFGSPGQFEAPDRVGVVTYEGTQITDLDWSRGHDLLDRREEDEVPPPPPEEEPEEGTGSVDVVLLGGTLNYTVDKGPPQAVANEAIEAARDTFGPPGQFDNGDTVLVFAYRGEEITDFNFDPGRDLLEAAEEEAPEPSEADVPAQEDEPDVLELPVVTEPATTGLIYFPKMGEVTMAVREEIGDAFEAEIGPANRWSEGRRVGTAFVTDVDPFQRREFVGIEVAERTRRTVEQAEEEEAEAEEPEEDVEAPSEPPEDFGRTVEGTFAQEVIEAGDLEEQEDWEVLMTAFPSLTEAQAKAARHQFPTPDAILDATPEELTNVPGIRSNVVDELVDSPPAEGGVPLREQIAEPGEGVQAPTPTEEPEPEPVEAEPEEEPVPEPEPEPEEEAEPEEPEEPERVDQVSQMTPGEIEAAVDFSTGGVDVDAFLIGSRLQEIRMTPIEGSDYEFFGDPGTITVTRKADEIATVIAAVERWDELVNHDRISKEDYDDLNAGRELTRERTGIDVPDLPPPTIPPPEGETEEALPYVEEEIELLVSQSVADAFAEVKMNVDADSLRIGWSIPERTDVRYKRDPREVQGQVSDPIPTVLEAIGEWESVAHVGSIDVEEVNRARRDLMDEYDIDIPTLPIPSESAVGVDATMSIVEAVELMQKGQTDAAGRPKREIEPGSLAETWHRLQNEMETVPIEEERLAGVSGYGFPVEVDQEMNTFFDENEITSAEKALQVHHTERVHDEVHAIIAQMLGAEPENFYDSSDPSDLPGYDLFYTFNLKRSGTSAPWTNPRFAPTDLFHELDQVDGDQMMILVLGTPLA